MKDTARFFRKEAGAVVCCQLCPHNCIVPDSCFGLCGVRGGKNGYGVVPFYGYITVLAVDPIEKKPLYHFRPGSFILSAGFSGCNFHCPFCQNWRISQDTQVSGRKMMPEELIAACVEQNISSIAYTYSEPVIHVEFLLDCMRLARKKGIANVLVTNGCVNNEAAGEILALTDAANIDLKCFSAKAYRDILGGDLETVLAFIRLAAEASVHIELTTLVVPGFNDSTEELDACTAFIASLDGGGSGAGKIPWHLSAFHPDYKWNIPATDPVFLEQARKRACKKLVHVYTGNIFGVDNDTVCSVCGAVLIRREGYCVDAAGLAVPLGRGRFYLCAACGHETPVER